MCKAKCVILEPQAAPNRPENTSFINTPCLPLFGQADYPHTFGLLLFQTGRLVNTL